jgi:hypothetical protein
MPNCDKYTLGEALFRLRISGNRVDCQGVNIHQLGRSLLSSQELINIAASDLILRRVSSGISLREPPFRRLLLQGHLFGVKKGSLDLFIPLLAHPELFTLITSDEIRSFTINVMSNLFTSAVLILPNVSNKKHIPEMDNVESHRLAGKIAPQLERLARCVTPKGGIENIELSFVEKENGDTRLDFRVERGSRDRIHDFVERALPNPIELIGEVRSIDLDQRRMTIVESVTGNRVEVEVHDSHFELSKLLEKYVCANGILQPCFDRHGNVSKRIEVRSIVVIDAPR